MTKEFKDMKGVIAIATTPFNNENLIDFESVDRLSNYYIESKKFSNLFYGNPSKFIILWLLRLKNKAN